MGHCKVKCSRCSEQQVRWGVHWGLWQGWIGGLCGGFSFAGLWRFAAEEAALGNQSAESPIGVGTQHWVCHGTLQGQKKPLQ